MFDLCFPVIFPYGIPHNEVSRGISMKPTSAGFVDINAEVKEDSTWPEGEATISISAYGESVGLELKSNSEDGAIIQRLLNKE